MLIVKLLYELFRINLVIIVIREKTWLQEFGKLEVIDERSYIGGAESIVDVNDSKSSRT